MKRCLELAGKGSGNTSPNPLVGAVLVHNEKIIGEGWHQQYGEAHAEINCLDSIKEENKRLIPDSVMYVSLEPCAHQGKTPSCALRLVQEKIRKVIVCNKDPFEKVSGKGIAILNANGIETQTGILENEGQWINRRFFCFHQQKRPYIILKWAQTEQGFFAPADRSRFQMSNEHSRQLVHQWRTEEAAIIVGYQTAKSDDPELTARLWSGKNPLRIVLDRKLKLPASQKIFNKEAPTWIINEIKETERENVKFIKLNFTKNIPEQIIAHLYASNILSLIVEGGATLFESFISKGLWDEARIFKTENSLENGIPAPMLTHFNKVFTSSLGTDILEVLVNKQSRYPYIKALTL